MANLEIQPENKGTTSSRPKYKTIKDIPIEVFKKMSMEEFDEAVRNFDKEAVAEYNRRCSERAKQMILSRIPKPVYIDVTNAVSINIDAAYFKLNNLTVYGCLLHLQLDSTTTDVFQMLAPPDPVDTKKFKVISKYTIFKTSKFKKICHNHALRAVDIYNMHSENKLRFKRVVSARKLFVHEKMVYVTFSATNQDGNTSFYQAGVRKIEGEYYLGILRDYSNEQVIAIISLTGDDVGQDLEAKREREYLGCAC